MAARNEANDSVAKTLENRPPPQRGPPSYIVSVVAGLDKGKQLVLDAEQPSRVLVGTSPTSDLVLSDREVSRRHAAFDLSRSEVHLVDLGSTNGTFVGNVAVVEVILRSGAQIRMGATTLQLERNRTRPLPRFSDASSFGRLVGSSLAMRRIYPICERLSQSQVPVLIEGESGTGKELLAEALHEAGPRANGPFIVFDCSAISPSLIESQLFGHERGAFSGAEKTRKGVFELAHRGTLFIDEIGDLEIGLQARLLRAIERGEVCRLGSEQWFKVDVRILAATRRDLDREVAAGRFRDDLLFRLAVARVELPPLRHRHGDVSLLARRFWSSLSGGREPPADLLTRFEAYAWPGNVRELSNAVARAHALGDLAEFDDETAADENAAPMPDLIERILAQGLPLAAARQRMIAEFERRYVARILELHDGDSRRAAEASGIARRYFNLLRARHGA